MPQATKVFRGSNSGLTDTMVRGLKKNPWVLRAKFDFGRNVRFMRFYLEKHKKRAFLP
jgi:hypothetical protein